MYLILGFKSGVPIPLVKQKATAFLTVLASLCMSKTSNINATDRIVPIGLAMSIDYCLFMMSRYRIERQSDWDDEIDTADIVQDAVAQAAVADDAASEVDVQMSGTAQCFAKMWKRISCRGASDGKDHDPKQMQSVTTVNETAGMVVSLRCASVPLTQQCAC